MSSSATSRLEALKQIVQAARNTEHMHPTKYTAGLKDGLQIALDVIDRELQYCRDVEAVVASVTSSRTPA